MDRYESVYIYNVYLEQVAVDAVTASTPLFSMPVTAGIIQHQHNIQPAHIEQCRFLFLNVSVNRMESKTAFIIK